MTLRVVPCAEWGAKPPRGPIRRVGRPSMIIEHHTAGHAPHLDVKPSESYKEAVAYARAVQELHFGRGWSDTGQNFLVTRSGHIFEGRHGSLEAIRAGGMVVSAHCPRKNNEPGIEHEHYGDEPLTPAQKAASLWLHVFICQHTGIKPTELYPHGAFFPTECPSATVRAWLPGLKAQLALELDPHRKPRPPALPRHLTMAWWQSQLKRLFG